MVTFGFLKNDTLAVLAILSFIESKKVLKKQYVHILLFNCLEWYENNALKIAQCMMFQSFN